MNWNEDTMAALAILCFCLAASLWLVALSFGPSLARKVFAAYYEAKLAFLRKSLGDGVVQSEPQQNNLTEETSRRRR